jgi:hypothetical protein
VRGGKKQQKCATLHLHRWDSTHAYPQPSLLDANVSRDTTPVPLSFVVLPKGKLMQGSLSAAQLTPDGAVWVLSVTPALHWGLITYMVLVALTGGARHVVCSTTRHVKARDLTSPQVDDSAPRSCSQSGCGHQPIMSMLVPICTLYYRFVQYVLKELSMF